MWQLLKKVCIPFLVFCMGCTLDCFAGGDKYDYEKVCEELASPVDPINLIDNVKYAFVGGFFKEKNFFQRKYLSCVFGGSHVSLMWSNGLIIGEIYDSAESVPFPASSRKYFDIDIESGQGSIGLDFSGSESFIYFEELKKKFDSQWVLESKRSPLGPGYVYIINVLDTSKSKSAIYFFFNEINQLIQVTFKNGDK